MKHTSAVPPAVKVGLILIAAALLATLALVAGLTILGPSPQHAAGMPAHHVVVSAKGHH
jgi:hypothetical protein